MRKKLMGAMLVLGLVALGSTAQAVPITGGTLFGGTLVLNGTVATATTVTFNPSIFLAGDGDYSGIPAPLVPVTFNTIQLNAFVPLTPLWTFTNGAATYSFNLLTLTVSRAGGVLSLVGTGISSITGIGTFENTEMVFSLSTQSPPLSSGLYSYSASTATPVPEPGTLLLIGSGLAGLALRRRRRA